MHTDRRPYKRKSFVCTGLLIRENKQKESARHENALRFLLRYTALAFKSGILKKPIPFAHVQLCPKSYFCADEQPR